MLAGAGDGLSMDWPTYRDTCDRGDVLSRYLLECTAGLLDASGEEALAGVLRGALAGDPLPKPRDHRGGAASDFFVLTLDTGAIRRIVDVLAGARRDGRRTLDGRSLGGFVEAWQEYLDWETGRHPRSPLRANAPRP